MTIKNILVCGAGIMGSGIAQLAIESGFDTFLFDTDVYALEKALDRVNHSIQRHIEKGKLNEAEGKRVLSRLKLKDNYREIKADMVIEAIVERMEAKTSLFRDLSQYLPEETILATNTSSLSVTEIAGEILHHGRFLGMHFFNPVPAMKLVEIVKTIYTNPLVVEAVLLLTRQMGKTAVLVKDKPGFIVNRIARQYYLEAFRMAEDHIAGYKTIDRLLESAGFRMGPFTLTDMIGQDINYATTRSLYQAFSQEPRFRPSSLQADLVKAGYLGKKTGRGFFEYQ